METSRRNLGIHTSHTSLSYGSMLEGGTMQQVTPAHKGDTHKSAPLTISRELQLYIDLKRGEVCLETLHTDVLHAHHLLNGMYSF